MKNKLRYIGLILLLSVLCVNNVYADEFVVTSVVDSTTVTKGSEASIKVNLQSSESLGECLFKFESDPNIEYVSIAGANGWVVNANGVEGFNISNSDDSGDAPSNGLNIAELKYRVNGDGNVVIKTVQCVSMINETSYKYNDVTVSFVAKDVADDTTLSRLRVTNGTMNPSNISGTDIDYIITLTSANFGLTMTTTNADYQDKIVVKDINGNVLSDVSNMTFSDPTGQGQMPLTVTVNGKTTYSLLVTYTQSNLDNSLASITINGKELSLIDGKYDYTFTVSKDITEFIVAATLKDNDNFTFGSASNAPDTFTIVDTVDIIIVVEPKDSSTGAKAATYTIEVTKEGSSSGSGNSGNSGTSGSTGNDGNVSQNPVTADFPMFLMAFILIASLIGSVVLYRKNLESYK